MIFTGACIALRLYTTVVFWGFERLTDLQSDAVVGEANRIQNDAGVGENHILQSDTGVGEAT